MNGKLIRVIENGHVTISTFILVRNGKKKKKKRRRRKCRHLHRSPFAFAAAWLFRGLSREKAWKSFELNDFSSALGKYCKLILVTDWEMDLSYAGKFIFVFVYLFSLRSFRGVFSFHIWSEEFQFFQFFSFSPLNIALGRLGDYCVYQDYCSWNGLSLFLLNSFETVCEMCLQILWVFIYRTAHHCSRHFLILMESFFFFYKPLLFSVKERNIFYELFIIWANTVM